MKWDEAWGSNRPMEENDMPRVISSLWALSGDAWGRINEFGMWAGQNVLSADLLFRKEFKAFITNSVVQQQLQSSIAGDIFTPKVLWEI